MNMKDMIQRMTDLENSAKKQLTESQQLAECPPDMTEGPMPAAPTNPGNPVTMSINLNASGAEHVQDLINMMKNAGLGDTKPAADAIMPMRQDMERLRAMVGEPEPEMEEDDIEEWDNSPEGSEGEPEYADHGKMIHDLSGGINREKKQFKAAQPGDNAMAAEAIKASLMAALAEKKAKPDFLDMDKDGDKKEPMKKAIKDKGSKPKKGEVPPQFKKK